LLVTRQSAHHYTNIKAVRIWPEFVIVEMAPSLTRQPINRIT